MEFLLFCINMHTQKKLGDSVYGDQGNRILDSRYLIQVAGYPWQTREGTPWPLSGVPESEKWSHSVVSDSLLPVDCSPPGSSIHGILQTRIMEWVAIAFSRGSSRPRDRTQVSCIAGGFFTSWATREASTAHDQEKNQPRRKTGKNLNGHFSKEGTQVSTKHMKRCSGPLLQKCQSNCNQLSLTPLRRAILQKISKDEMLQRARKTGTPPTLWAGMETGGCSHKRKQYGDSLEH